MSSIFAMAGYTPGPEQWPIHEALAEVRHGVLDDGTLGALPSLVILGKGEQAGGSYVGGHHAFYSLITGTPGTIVWLAGERYEDASAEYRYCVTACLHAGITRKGMFSAGDTGPWTLKTLNGNVLRVLQSEDPTKIAREAPNTIIMCEPGRQSFEAFEYLRRRVVPKAGVMLVAGTFEGYHSRWLAELWRQCQGDNTWGGVSLSLPSFANRQYYPGGEGDSKFRAELKRIRDSYPDAAVAEAMIRERYYGEPRTQKGMVFSEFREAYHVRDYAEYQPGFPVYLWADPGYAAHGSAYAILFAQLVNNGGGAGWGGGSQIRVFDELYEHERTNDEMITIVENHYAFRDVKKVVLDNATRQSTPQGSAFETWQARMARYHIPVTAQYVKIDERNNRIHDKLRIDPISGQPFLAYHPRCVWAIREFIGWQDESSKKTHGYRYRERSDGTIANDVPIDEDNHLIAALGYGIIDEFGMYDGARTPLPRRSVERMGYEGVFDQRQRKIAQLQGQSGRSGLSGQPWGGRRR